MSENQNTTQIAQTDLHETHIDFLHCPTNIPKLATMEEHMHACKQITVSYISPQAAPQHSAAAAQTPHEDNRHANTKLAWGHPRAARMCGRTVLCLVQDRHPYAVCSSRCFTQTHECGVGTCTCFLFATTGHTPQSLQAIQHSHLVGRLCGQLAGASAWTIASTEHGPLPDTKN